MHIDETAEPEHVPAGLEPQDKALFLEVWDLRDGELTDEQILIAIHLGHL